MRLAAGAAAERFIPMNHPGETLRLGRRNEEPLTLPDRTPVFDLGRPKTCDRAPYVVNTVTRHRRGEPVTFIVAKQELVLGVAVPHHQYQMAQFRPHVENFGNTPVLTTNIEEFAVTIPAH